MYPARYLHLLLLRYFHNAVYKTVSRIFKQQSQVEVRQKYSATRRIFNSLLGVSSGDETLRLMFDILLQI